MEVPRRFDENGNVTNEFYVYACECCDKGIEIFVDVIGYKGMYQVSNTGKVKSLSRTYQWRGIHKRLKENLLKCSKNNGGYRIATLSNVAYEHIGVHVLVAKNFIPNPENLPEVNHADGIKSNNFVTNFEWCTSSRNKLHAFEIGLKTPTWLGKMGKDNPSSRTVHQYSKDGLYIETFYSGG